MTFHRNLLLGLLVVQFSGFLFTRSAAGADEVDPRDLVDISAAVCLEVPQAELRWSKLESSRLLTRLKAFPPTQRFLAGDGFQKWTQMQEFVRRATGKSLSDHLLGVCAESLVVAVYLPNDRPPQGVLIARARDAGTLKSALQAWATLEPQQESKSLQYHGQSYVRRAKSAKSSEVVFYTIFDRTIAISDQERLVQQVIDLHATANRKNAVVEGPRTLRELTAYRTNRTRLPGDAAAYLFLNPRMWDRVVDETVGKSPDVGWFQPVFRQITAVAAALRMDDEVVVDLVTDLGDSLSPQWRNFVERTKGTGGWGERVPTNSIAAVSSRMDLSPLIHAWLLVNPDAKSDDFARGRNVLKSLLLGRDLFTDVLPQSLRDWTIGLVPAQESASDDSPVDLVSQFSLESARDTGRPAIQDSVDNALQFGLTALGVMLSHQRGGRGESAVIVERESTADGTIRTLSGLKAWKPSYAVTSQHLLGATNRRALPIRNDSTPDPKSRLTACEQRYFPKVSQLAWLDSVALRRLLGSRSDWIAAQLAPDSTDGRQRVQKHLAKIQEVAEVFDAAFVSAGFDENQVRITFGVALDRNE